LCDNPHFRGWGSPGGTALGGAAMVSRSVCAERSSAGMHNAFFQTCMPRAIKSGQLPL
jgi:hypothetical protein